MRKQIHDEGYRRLAASTQFSTKLTTKLTHALPHPHTPTLIFRLNLSLSPTEIAATLVGDPIS